VWEFSPQRLRGHAVTIDTHAGPCPPCEHPITVKANKAVSTEMYVLSPLSRHVHRQETEKGSP